MKDSVALIGRDPEQCIGHVVRERRRAELVVDGLDSLTLPNDEGIIDPKTGKAYDWNKPPHK